MLENLSLNKRSPNVLDGEFDLLLSTIPGLIRQPTHDLSIVVLALRCFSTCISNAGQRVLALDTDIVSFELNEEWPGPRRFDFCIVCPAQVPGAVDEFPNESIRSYSMGVIRVGTRTS